MQKRSASTDHKGQEYPEPHTALPALAQLLGRQAARQFLAERVTQAPASPVSPARNASRSSDPTTKAT